MTVTNPYQQYLDNQINTATPEKLLLMLLDGGIRFCQKAVQAIEQKDISEAHTNLVKAQNIVLELLATLDRSYPIAENLAALYDYMNRRLIEANIKKDATIINEVIGFFKELKEAFAQAALIAKNNNNSMVRGGLNVAK
ncbi:flagellar protein FliS [Carboxydocella sporoproducens DSM 16521]|uniref:Flagellar secretion chaperone FliS n=2 Tax=Carboxydocella TaxID=178898 RepID=A0A1T4QW40_9FIRM|nr:MULTISPECIES: flagellar export chaperone FliS [Carboxydocella]AVX21676.1 flagellar protein FliS [Carboxydocella thermautotrophica]AVX32087.1 flagellar protein FliS [Carboxydocella thermautotrophica]SKA07856.1 flagellar protein FliS [Carboxydocella sporoproducens DSM 16521]